MNLKKPAYTSLLAMVLGALATPALAEQVELSGTVGVEKIALVNGAEIATFVDPEAVVPGDRLKFVTAYRNHTSGLVENFVLTNPIPAAVALALPADGFEISVDGGVTFSPLASAVVPLEKGGTRPALPADATHVRWTFSKLTAGQAGTVEYFAVVR